MKRNMISVNGVKRFAADFKEKYLLPGDILLFRSPGFFSWLIRIKTGGHFSHVELYVGNGTVWASRNGLGVERYPLDLDHVVGVLRPTKRLNWAKGIKWFETVARGQKYDWLGLLNFYIAKWQGGENKKMFCSEFIVRVFRAFEAPLFDYHVDADGVAPCDIPHSSYVKYITGEVL